MEMNHGKYFCPIETYASGAQDSVTTSTTAKVVLHFARDLSHFKFVLDIYDGHKVTMAHLHCATAGMGGTPVIFSFGKNGEAKDGMYVNEMLSDGSLTSHDLLPGDYSNMFACGVPINNIASLYKAVLERKIYVNVHTIAHPNGEVHGQVINSCPCA